MTDSGKDAEVYRFTNRNVPDIPVPEDLRIAPSGLIILSEAEENSLPPDEYLKYSTAQMLPVNAAAVGAWYDYISARRDEPGEVQLSIPRYTDNPWTYFGRTEDDSGIAKVIQELADSGCTPDKFPKVADLGAGGAPMASKVLIPNGWKPVDIYNIDIVIPSNNPAPGTNWLNWDLASLAQIEIGRWPIPENIKQYKSAFDLVTMTSAFAPLVAELDGAGRFLLKRGGLLFQAGLGDQFLTDRSTWERLDTGLYIKVK